MGGDCEFCTYARSRTQLTLDALNKNHASTSAN
jgi:hypothetical protein